MELENKNLAIAFLALTIIASGCAHTGGGTDTEASTSPVAVNEFSAFPNPSPADQTVQFRMEVQNNGDVDAENVRARMFNPPFASEGSQPKTWRDSDSGSVTVNERTFDLGDTLRAPGENTPSVPKTKTISLKAPSLDQGRTISYDFFSKMFYQYETQADTEIQVMSSQRFRDEGTTRSKPTLENTDGPVQMEIRTATPLVFYQGDGVERTSEMCVIVKNSGQGTPFIAQQPDNAPSVDSTAWDGSDYDVNEDNRNKVWLEVEDVGNIEFAANGENGGNMVPVELIGGQGVQCFDMTATFGTSGNDIQQTVNVALSSKYGYTKETQTSVTVEGRRDTGNNNNPPEEEWTFGDLSSNDRDALESWWAASGSSGDFNAENFCPVAQEEDEELFNQAGCHME